MMRCNRWIIELLVIVQDAGENPSKILQVFLVIFKEVESKSGSET